PGTLDEPPADHRPPAVAAHGRGGGTPGAAHGRGRPARHPAHGPRHPPGGAGQHRAAQRPRTTVTLGTSARVWSTVRIGPVTRTDTDEATSPLDRPALSTISPGSTMRR